MNWKDFLLFSWFMDETSGRREKSSSSDYDDVEADCEDDLNEDDLDEDYIDDEDEIDEDDEVDVEPIFSWTKVKKTGYDYTEIKVSGFTHRTEMEKSFILNELQVGDSVCLQNEPDNVYNPHALKVMQQNVMLGYVEDSACERLHQYLKDDRIVSVTVSSISNRDDKYVNIYLDVYFKSENGQATLPER